jgi:hypothetical protein
MLDAMIGFFIGAVVTILLSFLLQNVYNKGTLVEGGIELAMKGFIIWKYMLNHKKKKVADIIYFLMYKGQL